MKKYHVEYDITAPDVMGWNEDSNHPGFRRIDPGYNKPYVFVPSDAAITEIPIPLSDGIYVTPSGSLYKKSLNRWYYWDGDAWIFYDGVHVEDFMVDLIRIDA